MSIALKMAEAYVPAFIKKRELKKLLDVAARAFRTVPPSIERLSFGDSLRLFAEFTERETSSAIDRGEDLMMIKKQLFEGAYEMGERFRRAFRLTDGSEALKAGQLIYGILGINFLSTPRGEVTINKCFFSERYSTRTCHVISSLDEGLMAGLSRGGTFTFFQRMTEGFELCKANLIPKGTSNA